VGTRIGWVGLSLLTLLAGTATAAPPQATPLAEEAERAEPGLALTVENLAAGTSDTRPVRMLALHVPEDQAPTPFLAPGQFRATWTGDLNLRLRERLAFVAEGRGKVSIRVKDKVVFVAEGDDLSAKAGAVVRLDKGKNPIVVTYESPDGGDAFVRIAWKEQNALRAEPVPPTMFTHDASGKPVAEGMRLRAGRQLLADLRCTKCHAAESTGMPDLATDAPALTHVGGQLHRDWMAAWIDNPAAFRRDAHMPRVFRKGGTEPADVAAYLATLGGPGAPAADAPAPEQVARGGQLFSGLMCAACHTTPDAGTIAETETRVPLGYVKAKFRPGALRQYLLKPEAHYAWNPMPNFKLSEEEAAALAAYLLDKAGKTVAAGAAGDAAKGKQLVASSGCLNCHAIEGESTALGAPALAAIDGGRWTHGCLAPDAAALKNAPDFAMTERERHALLAFAATGRASLARETAAEFSARQVAAMNCTACHARDGKESRFGTDFAADAGALAAAFPPPQPAANAEAHGEVFAPDQRPPMLTWTGEKLRPEWAAAFIAGEVSYKPRPYLHARMPAWPARAALLARGLSAEHGYAPASEPNPAPDETMAPVGQKLIAAAGGFSCVQCHAVGAAPPLAPFEAPAPDMQYITERLRKDHFHRWMLNPIKVDPGTKMPAFADSEGRSAIRDVYDGDGTKQFESIWQFLLRGKDVKPPQ
jgi:mono/diheme cytochrome c family protein